MNFSFLQGKMCARKIGCTSEVLRARRYQVPLYYCCGKSNIYQNVAVFHNIFFRNCISRTLNLLGNIYFQNALCHIKFFNLSSKMLHFSVADFKDINPMKVPATIATQKMKFSIKDFFSKCDQICSFLQT